MKSLPLFAAVMVFTATPALAQQRAPIDPLEVLGVSFGASASDVVQACARAGLTVERIDTGSARAEGYFNIAATGAVFMGYPARLALGGGSFGPTGEQASGLQSVWAIVESDSAPSLRSLMSRCLDSLVWTYGPSTYIRARPENIESIGFAEEHFWQTPSPENRGDLHVTVEASLETRVRGRYVLQVQYALVDS